MENTQLINVPNTLTLLRISLIPILVIIYYADFSYHYMIAAMVFTLASMTDWLDGFLARRYNQLTNFGAFCDPLADKLIVIIALILLVSRYHSVLVSVAAIIIVSRELIISGLREWMAKVGCTHNTTVTYSAKVKTTLQMVAIACLMALTESHLVLLINISIILLFIAAALTLWTMYGYLYKSWQNII
jgi:CDP-diacylglycerol--glycerol-3-phosphate 3-phosphatidyltransferase